jgi:hypothetical protein
LQREFYFYSRRLGRISIPAGFDTDFASVPRVPIIFWLTGDTSRKAAVVHDWLYRTQTVSRHVADAVLFEASDNEPLWRRVVMWAGVRAFGWVAWRANRRSA